MRWRGLILLVVAVLGWFVLLRPTGLALDADRYPLNDPPDFSPDCFASQEGGKLFAISRFENAVTYTLEIRGEPKQNRKAVREETKRRLGDLPAVPYLAEFGQYFEELSDGKEQRFVGWRAYGFHPMGTPVALLVDSPNGTFLPAMAGTAFVDKGYFGECSPVTRLTVKGAESITDKTNNWIPSICFPGVSSVSSSPAVGRRVTDTAELARIDSLVQAIPNVDLLAKESDDMLQLDKADIYEAGSQQWTVVQYMFRQYDWEQKRSFLVCGDRAWLTTTYDGNLIQGPLLVKVNGLLLMAQSSSFAKGEGADQIIILLDGDVPLFLSCELVG
jgi:hypothetical protein